MNSTPAVSNSISTTDLSESDCYEYHYPEKGPFLILYLVIILIGIPFNSFSLFVSCQHIRQRNELGIYLFNLALSDLFFIMGLPIWVDFILRDTWIHGRSACIACVFLLFANFYTSAALLCCIAVNRYLAVVHPLKYRFLRKLNAAVTITAVMWVLVITFIAVTMFPADIYDAKHAICFDVLPLKPREKLVYKARFIIGFLLPTALVGFCCWRICVEVRTNRATGEQERRRVSRLLGVVLLTLLLCFGPIHIMMLLRALLEDCGRPTWLFYTYKTSVALACLNCLADPLLYCFITRTGRANVTRAFLLLQRKRKGDDQARTLSIV